MNTSIERIDRNFNEIIITEVLPAVSKAFLALYNDVGASKIILNSAEKKLAKTMYNEKAAAAKAIIDEYIKSHGHLFNSNQS